MFPLIISAIEDAGTRTFMEQLYMQYKKLKGNSFVDKIWNEVQTWTIDE